MHAKSITGSVMGASTHQQAVAIPLLEKRHIEGAPHQQHFIFPEGLGGVATTADREAAVFALHSLIARRRQFAIVVSKGGLSLFPASNLF